MQHFAGELSQTCSNYDYSMRQFWKKKVKNLRLVLIILEQNYQENVMNIIQTQGLTKNFDDLFAVDRIGLEVPKASIYGFLGPNGAGKTTTIRMLLGLIRPTYGRVRIFGKEYIDSRVEILKHVGSLVEQPSLYPHLTGWENMEIIRRYRDLNNSDITRALEIVKLLDDSRRLVKHYSTGMRQRLGIAIALLGMPDVLILDEPTNGLDPAGIHEIRSLLIELVQSNGTTIFLSSHLLNEVEQIATKIGVINKGRLVFQGSQQDLQAKIPQNVIFELDDLSKGMEVIKNDGQQAKLVNGSKLVIPICGKADAARLSRKLIDSGVSVHEARIEKPSLEELFLELTEQDGNKEEDK